MCEPIPFEERRSNISYQSIISMITVMGLKNDEAMSVFLTFACGEESGGA